MKTLICVILLALHVLAKERNAEYKQLTNSIPQPNPTVAVSTLDPSRSASTDQASEKNYFQEQDSYPNTEGNRILSPQYSIDHNTESVPVRHPIFFGIDRHNPPHHYPTSVQRSYPVPVVYPEVNSARYSIVSPVPYPQERITLLHRQVPYQFHTNVNRPVFIPGSRTYPVLEERRVAYPTQRIVYQPVSTTHNVHQQNSVPVQFLHPRPVSYEPQYPIGAIKQYPVPYEREIPIRHLVPASIPIPYNDLNKHLSTPVGIAYSGTNNRQGIVSNDYSTLLANHYGSIAHGRVKCDGEPIPTGSFISNSGAISLEDYYAAHKTPYSNPQLEPQQLDYFKFSPSSVKSKLAEPIVEVRKSLEIPIASILPKTDDGDKSSAQIDLKTKRS